MNFHNEYSARNHLKNIVKSDEPRQTIRFPMFHEIRPGFEDKPNVAHDKNHHRPWIRHEKPGVNEWIWKPTISLFSQGTKAFNSHFPFAKRPSLEVNSSIFRSQLFHSKFGLQVSSVFGFFLSIGLIE